MLAGLTVLPLALALGQFAVDVQVIGFTDDGVDTVTAVMDVVSITCLGLLMSGRRRQIACRNRLLASNLRHRCSQLTPSLRSYSTPLASSS